MDSHNSEKRRIKPYKGHIIRICLIFFAAASAFAVLVFAFGLNGSNVPLPSTPPSPAVPGSKAPAASTPGALNSAQPTQTPPPEDDGSVYVATSIIVDGNNVATLASREAAEELINNIISYYNGLFPHASSRETSIENTIEFAASPDSGSIISYDTAYSLLTGADSPLRVVTTIRYSEIETILHEVEIKEDPSMYAGTRYIEVCGRDGQRISLFESTYVNGVEEVSARLNEGIEVAAVKEIIRVGTRSLPPDGYTPNGSWGLSNCPDVGLSFIIPCEGDVTRYFGFYGQTFHNGVDFNPPAGSAVKVACAGKVRSALELGEYGRVVEIDCGGGVILRYAGLSLFEVSVGQSVESAQTIGAASGAGVHIELIIDGVPRNPRPYLLGLI